MKNRILVKFTALLRTKTRLFNEFHNFYRNKQNCFVKYLNLDISVSVIKC